MTNDTTIAAINAEIASLQTRITKLEQAKGLLSGDDDAAKPATTPVTANGHTPSKGLGLAIAKKSASVVAKAGKVESAKVAAPDEVIEMPTRKAVIEYLTSAPEGRRSTGEMAVQFFSRNNEVAAAFLGEVKGIQYNLKGRGGYWTLSQ